MDGQRPARADPGRPAFVICSGGGIAVAAVDEQHSERLVPELRHGCRPADDRDHVLLEVRRGQGGPEPRQRVEQADGRVD